MNRRFRLGEKIKEWTSNNSGVVTFSATILGVTLIAVISIVCGEYTIGEIVLGLLALFSGFVAFYVHFIYELGCGARIVVLGLAVLFGFSSYNVGSIGTEVVKKKEVQKEYRRLLDNGSLADFRSFFNQYKDRNLDYNKRANLLQQYYNISLDSCYATLGNSIYFFGIQKRRSGLGYIEDFLKNCHSEPFTKIAMDKIKEVTDSLYAVALAKDTYKGWEEYQSLVPPDQYRDSETQQFKAGWSTESRAWKTASTINTIISYTQYLSLYPQGKHQKEADKLIIDMQVDATFAGQHGNLPEMNRSASSGGPNSSIRVYNKTAYTLTLLYSGVESKRLVLAPQSKGNIKLENGVYRIAASVDAPDIGRYTGKENLVGGTYEVEYYIETRSIPSTHY